jgi:hypothetical protein
MKGLPDGRSVRRKASTFRGQYNKDEEKRPVFESTISALNLPRPYDLDRSTTVITLTFHVIQVI